MQLITQYVLVIKMSQNQPSKNICNRKQITCSYYQHSYYFVSEVSKTNGNVALKCPVFITFEKSNTFNLPCFASPHLFNFCPSLDKARHPQPPLFSCWVVDSCQLSASAGGGWPVFNSLPSDGGRGPLQQSSRHLLC